MRWLALVSALALGLAMTGNVSAAVDGKAKGNKKGQRSAGVVTAVKGGAKDGTITIKTAAPRKGQGGQAAGAEKTFKVGGTTTFDKVTVKKGEGTKPERTSTPATFADVQKGTRVAVVVKTGDVADAVHILGAGKKKKGL